MEQVHGGQSRVLRLGTLSTIPAGCVSHPPFTGGRVAWDRRISLVLTLRAVSP